MIFIYAHLKYFFELYMYVDISVEVNSICSNVWNMEEV